MIVSLISKRQRYLLQCSLSALIGQHINLLWIAFFKYSIKISSKSTVDFKMNVKKQAVNVPLFIIGSFINFWLRIVIRIEISCEFLKFRFFKFTSKGFHRNIYYFSNFFDFSDNFSLFSNKFISALSGAIYCLAYPLCQAQREYICGDPKISYKYQKNTISTKFIIIYQQIIAFQMVWNVQLFHQVNFSNFF